MGMIAKPKPHRLVKAAKRRQEMQRTKAVRAAVFARDQNRCRVCWGPAHELHELKFRSLGGKRSIANCIAVCGQLGLNCHEALQRHTISVTGTDANGPLTFSWPEPRTT